MAIFLSRIKKALNLGTKSITQNGTYTASSDGYDGYSSVEVNVAGVTPTPITPSNASPVALTSGSAVNPTANGYAIESYRNCSPSSTGHNTFTTDDIVRFVDTGVIVDSITSITPDNSDPPRLEAAKNYFSMRAGYAISGYQSITPTNNLPTSIGSNGIYKPSTSGYIIKSYSQETPSDTSPASVASGDIIRPRASGYLYATVQPKVKTGTFTNSSSATDNITVDIGFKPKYLCIWYASSVVLVYDERHNSGESYFRTSSTPAFDAAARFNQSSVGNTIQSITSTGFIVRSSSGRTWHYFAIG